MIKSYKFEELKELKEIKDLQTTSENKLQYGEVYTPLSLVQLMLTIIPSSTFKNPFFKWLDPGSGTGNFFIILYFKLLDGLENILPDIEQRKNHIINEMLYMVEIRPENVKILRTLFGDTANIFEGSFLDYNTPQTSDLNQQKQAPLQFDVVIGNPPFNSNGLKKVPTSNANKKNDGITIWSAFVIKSISLLREDSGMLCMFIPSIWLKPDKQGMYKFLMQYDIQYLNCFSNTTTNAIFHGHAQTPSCFFLLTKRETTNMISIYDFNIRKYVQYFLNSGDPVPVFGQEIINKLRQFCYLQSGTIKTLDVIKTNMPPKGTFLSPTKSEEYSFPNVATCKLTKDNSPELIINYSTKPLKFAGVPKLILAHKMYGFPYLDIEGVYGISNRDNYVIIKEDITDLVKIQQFLSTKTALYLFEATRYRMKYLEKYAFQLIPDICYLTNFPKYITDKTIAKYFGFDKKNIESIENLHKKQYKFFV
jgi:hypothetical protein